MKQSQPITDAIHELVDPLVEQWIRVAGPPDPLTFRTWSRCLAEHIAVGLNGTSAETWVR